MKGIEFREGTFIIDDNETEWFVCCCNTTEGLKVGMSRCLNEENPRELWEGEMYIDGEEGIYSEDGADARVKYWSKKLNLPILNGFLDTIIPFEKN
jgi:hypothetical protein